MKRIAVLEFGSMRSFASPLSNGVSLFENNLIQFLKFLGNPNDIIIDMYILTDPEEDLVTKRKFIEKNLQKYNINLIYFKIWDDIKTEYEDLDKRAGNLYKEKCRISSYGGNLYGYDQKEEFNPGNLWFRRYLNYSLFEEIVKIKEISYSLVCLSRFFSTKFLSLKSIDVNEVGDNLLFSLDTFFISKESNIKKLLEFGKETLIYNPDLEMKNYPSILDDSKFISEFYDIDSIINTHVLSSEAQIFYYIYRNFEKYKNLRFNFTRHLHSDYITNLIYTDYIDDDFNSSYSNTENANLFISIFR